MNPIISIKNFSKSFGRNQVIHDLEFEVRPGEIFAFLGANGSGKTTTIRCLLGIYQPSSGELLVKGQRYSAALANSLGYLPEERGLYLDANVQETIAYFGKLKGMSSADAWRAAGEYLERVDLPDKAKVKIKKLSSGQQQKIQLGITIINQPELLILDEPTKGLDPVNRSLLMELLHELNQKNGTSILFSTHQMEEVEKIAHRLVMIKEGHRALYGDVTEVKASFGNDTIQIDYNGTLPKPGKLFTIQRQDANYAELKLSPGRDSQEILEYLVANKVQLHRFEQTMPSLNEIFVMVQKQKNAE